MTDHLKHSGLRSARINYGQAASEDHETSANVHRNHTGDDPHPVHDAHGLNSGHTGPGDSLHAQEPDEPNLSHHGHGEGTPGFHSTEHPHASLEDLHR